MNALMFFRKGWEEDELGMGYFSRKNPKAFVESQLGWIDSACTRSTTFFALRTQSWSSECSASIAHPNLLWVQVLRKTLGYRFPPYVPPIFDQWLAAHRVKASKIRKRVTTHLALHSIQNCVASTILLGTAFQASKFHSSAWPEHQGASERVGT